ncbi:MAG: class I SAM-dependent DNA methyltransferase, partial [Ottowia sp.]|nr:class I SAM-dependent DNA methyltransferase [Ottowia sp.]
MGHVAGLEQHIREYRNGRDLTDTPRGLTVIDLYGLEIEDVRNQFPAVYQWLLNRVKPDRDLNPRRTRRERWWIFGEPCPRFREASRHLRRYIATVKTSRHRTFQLLDASILPDSKLIACTSDDSYLLGILSSRLHVLWATAIGSKLGAGNDPTYVKTLSFEAFPFPNATPDQHTRIGDLAEQLDAHRKRQQAAHDGLTLTGMYNVLEKLRADTPLSAKDKTIHEQGLVSVLRELHDALDTAVFDAYGWADLAPALVGRPGATTPLPDKPAEQAAAEEDLLTRLVALNAERAAEEARGQVRWLRPDYQNPQAGAA